jgi:hypothetical protein
MKHKTRSKVIGDAGVDVRMDLFGHLVIVFCTGMILALVTLGVLAIYAYVR